MWFTVSRTSREYINYHVMQNAPQVMKIEGYGRRFTFSFVFFLNDFLFRLQLLGKVAKLLVRFD